MTLLDILWAGSCEGSDRERGGVGARNNGEGEELKRYTIPTAQVET